MSTTHPNLTASNTWWLFLLQGISGILLGLLLITAPKTTLLAVVTFLGFYWLFTGVLALVQVFVDHTVPWIWSLLSGLLGIGAGVLVLRHPLLAALTLPTVIVIILGVEALFMAGVQFMAGIKGGGIGAYILAIVNVLIGLLLLSSPVAAGFAVPLVFGVILLAQGVAHVIWAFRVR
jgi:uncharacterized membrane protein HdeD (DUF308 family)